MLVSLLLVLAAREALEQSEAKVRLTLTAQGADALLPEGRELKGDRVLQRLAIELPWTGPVDELRDRLTVVQRGDERSAELVATGESDEEASRLAAAWAQAIVESRPRRRPAFRNLVPDPSFEQGLTWFPYHGGGGEYPVLSRTEERGSVAGGKRALLVTARNSERSPRSKYVWSHPVTVDQGHRYLVSAYVSGAARPGRPLRLGVRLPSGAVTQEGIEPETRLTAREDEPLRRFAGKLTVPAGADWIQLAVWQENVPPRATTAFTVDRVSVTRLRNALPNPGFERREIPWLVYTAGGGPPPQLRPTAEPALVASGRRALLVTARDPRAGRGTYAWTAQPLSVAAGQAYELAARVSRASPAPRPLLLGVRLQSGEVTQAGIRPLRGSIATRGPARRGALRGLFSVPQGVSSFQLAVYSRSKRFALDDVRVTLSRLGPGVVIATPVIPVQTARWVPFALVAAAIALGLTLPFAVLGIGSIRAGQGRGEARAPHGG